MDPIVGVVKKGKRFGRELGFPTANIACTLKLPEGVYGAYTILPGDPVKQWPSLTYFKDGILEVHLIDAEIDLYDTLIKVYLTNFIRAPIPYTTAAAMRAQIQQDLKQVSS